MLRQVCTRDQYKYPTILLVAFLLRPPRRQSCEVHKHVRCRQCCHCPLLHPRGYRQTSHPPRYPLWQSCMSILFHPLLILDSPPGHGWRLPLLWRSLVRDSSRRLAISHRGKPRSRQSPIWIRLSRRSRNVSRGSRNVSSFQTQARAVTQDRFKWSRTAYE